MIPGSLDLPADHEDRLAQARKRAAWELGDESWADLFVAAYLNPQTDHEVLTANMDDGPKDPYA